VNINCKSNLILCGDAEYQAMYHTAIPGEVPTQYASPNNSIISFQITVGKPVINFHSNLIIETFASARDIAIVMHSTAIRVIKMYSIDHRDGNEFTFSFSLRSKPLSYHINDGYTWAGEQTNEWKSIVKYLESLKKFETMI
jgi:hypothetical protein